MSKNEVVVCTLFPSSATNTHEQQEDTWNASKRHELYLQQLGRVTEHQTSIASNLNQKVGESVVAFVRGCPVYSSSNTLPTALLFTGVAPLDYSSRATTLHLTTACPLLASLDPKYCSNMKLMMRSLIDQALTAMDFADLACNQLMDEDGMEGFALDAITAAGSGGGHSCKVSKEKSKLPNYDIQILVGCFERYKRKRLVDVGLGGPSPPLSPNSNYNTSNPSNLIKDKLVVVINDFESFDPQLFHSFVNICSLYSDRIPFVLVIHLATSIESFRQVIPTGILAKMNFEKFQLVNNVVFFETLVQEMILADPSTMKLGDKVFQLLLDNFQLYNLSVTSMTRCIQYALMDHYYGNPLSILTGGVSGGGEELDGDLNNVSTAGMIGMLSEEERDEIADNIRMLPSFKRHVEELFKTAKKLKRSAGKLESPKPSICETSDVADPTIMSNEQDEALEQQQQQQQKQQLDNSSQLFTHAKRLIEEDPTYLLNHIPKLVQGLHEYNFRFDRVFRCLLTVRRMLHTSAGVFAMRNMYKLALREPIMDTEDIKITMLCLKKWTLDKYEIALEECIKILAAPVHPASSLVPSASSLEMTAEIAELEKFRLAIVDLLYDSEEEEDGVGEEMDFGEDKLMSVSSSSSKPKSKKQMTMLYSSANRRRALTNNKADEIYALERATQIVNAQRKSKVSSRSSRHTFLVEHESDVDMLKGVQNEDGGGVKRSRQMTAMQEAEELRRRLFLYMEKLFRDNLKWHKTVALHEVFYYNNEVRLKKTFNTQPREAIHTAFRHSRHYVVCDCCNDEQLSHSQHDTSIAYRIYLECGKMINLYDWYVAFGTILERDGKQHSESQVHARFAKAISELQYLGFIKLTNRKMDHVMRLTW